MTAADVERAAFEEWWNGTTPGDPMPYGNGVKGYAWMAWQSARATPASLPDAGGAGVEEISRVTHDAYCDEMVRQGFGPLSRWPLIADDHASRWRAVARAVLSRLAPKPLATGEAKCPGCGSENPSHRKCGFGGHMTVHDVPVGPFGLGGIRPNTCVLCDNPFHDSRPSRKGRW